MCLRLRRRNTRENIHIHGHMSTFLEISLVQIPPHMNIMGTWQWLKHTLWCGKVSLLGLCTSKTRRLSESANERPVRWFRSCFSLTVRVLCSLCVCVCGCVATPPPTQKHNKIKCRSWAVSFQSLPSFHLAHSGSKASRRSCRASTALMERRMMDAEGGSALHREWRAAKLAVVVVLQNLLVAACLLVTLYVYWSLRSHHQEQVSDLDVECEWMHWELTGGDAAGH